MSRVGKMPIEIVSGVTITKSDNTITVKGPKGELSQVVHDNISVEITDKQVIVTRQNDLKENRALHGLTRSLIANMVEGVIKGFEKRLEIIGVGYKANIVGTDLDLALGFSHPVKVKPLDGVKFEMDTETKDKIIVIISGIDKQKVGQTAAVIRAYRKPEPYKGKGIRYVGEKVRRKAGKTAA